MRLADKISDFLKNKNLTYMKNEKNTMYVLPYENNKRKIKIRMEVDEESNSVRMGFFAPLYNGSDEVKKEILKLNLKLIKGTMGIAEDNPDMLEFVLSFDVDEKDDFTEELYFTNLGFCLGVHNNLVERNLLKEEKVNEE